MNTTNEEIVEMSNEVTRFLEKLSSTDRCKAGIALALAAILASGGGSRLMAKGLAAEVALQVDIAVEKLAKD